MDYVQTAESLVNQAVYEKPALLVLAESHKGAAHERAMQDALVAALPAHTAVIIEEGSFGDSLEYVADLVRARGDLMMRYAAPKAGNTPASLSEAFVFSRSRAIYEHADQALQEGHAFAAVFCGAGHLQGIAAAAAAGQTRCLLVNTADVMSLHERRMMKSFLCEQFAAVQQTQAKNEINKIMQTVTFAYDAKKVIQLRAPHRSA